MIKRYYVWVVVGLLWVVALLNYLDRQVIFSLFPPIQADLRLSNVELGLLSTAFLWVYAFLSPFGGFLADKFGRRRIILGSLVVWSLVTWATAYARNFHELLTARALMGISEAFYLPAALAMIADYHGPRTRSLATGLHQSGLYVGIMLGGVGGGWLGQLYGWRSVFVLLGAAGVIYSAVVAFPLREPSRMESQVETECEQAGFVQFVRTLLRSPGYLLFIGAAGLGAMAYWMVYTWLPMYLYEQFGMTLAGAGFSATFYIQASSFVGILAGGILADRWSRTNPNARLLTMLIGFVAAGPFLFVVGSTASVAVLIVSLVVFGLGRGFNDANTMPAMCQIVSSASRATAYGLYNFVTCLVGGAMAGFAGALKDTVGLGLALQVSAVLLVLSGLILLRVRARIAGRNQDAAPEIASAPIPGGR